MTLEDWRAWVTALCRPYRVDDEEPPVGCIGADGWVDGDSWLWLLRSRYGEDRVAWKLGAQPPPPLLVELYQSTTTPCPTDLCAYPYQALGQTLMVCSGACRAAGGSP